MTEKPIITRVFTTVQEIDATQWDALLAQQATPTPFMRHAYLAALQTSGSATPETGWGAHFITLWRATSDGEQLVAACPLYVKSHSWGEYVFDMAWARAYQEHGLHYYAKAVVAVPFTPVPGSRLLALNDALRSQLARTVQAWCEAQRLSSAHVLFGDAADHAALEQAGWMARAGVQFHWQNRDAGCAATALPYADFADFMTQLQAVKRKKIRQERQRVAQAGVTFEVLAGAQIGAEDWDFFYRCYAQTYLEHGNPPYLSRDFFEQLARDLPAHWVLFIAQRNGQRIACSLIATSAPATPNSDTKDAGLQEKQAHPAIKSENPLRGATAYGRYWGALERVDMLHFEACYYQPLQWCIANGLASFEGGAQGEHKIARALLPVATASYHWLAHPAFADAVERFLEREGEGMADYLQALHTHSPFRGGSADDHAGMPSPHATSSPPN